MVAALQAELPLIWTTLGAISRIAGLLPHRLSDLQYVLLGPIAEDAL